MRYNSSLFPKTSIIHIVALLAGYGCYALLNILFLGLFPFVLPVLLLAPKSKQLVFEALFSYSLTFLTRIWLPLIGIYKIEKDTGQIPPPGEPAILVVNHRSRIEGPLLMSYLKKTGVLMKSSYARLPVFSSLVKYNNFVSVDPKSLDSLAKAIVRCKEILSDGYKLVVFPEGTRARSKRMLPFKDIAFRLSIDTDVAVIPIIMHTNYPFMAKVKGSAFPPVTMKLTCRSLPPVKCIPGERSSEFCERVKRMMAMEIKKLDSGTVWETL